VQGVRNQIKINRRNRRWITVTVTVAVGEK